MSGEIRGCNDFELIKYGLKESTLKEKENKKSIWDSGFLC